MENKIEKPIEGVYIQVFENKKVVQKYVPIENVKLANEETLGEFLNKQENRIKVLETNTKNLKYAFATIIKSIGGVENEDI